MRAYFFKSSGRGTGGFGVRSALPPAIKILLMANGAIFLLQMASGRAVTNAFGLSPTDVAGGAIWQLFTYMFLHGGFMHLLFNMFALWMFGRDLEHDWGTREFMKFYLVCGVGAGVVTQIALWGSPIPTIGASGAIFGILLAFGMMYPNRLIYLWMFIPIKAKYMVVLFGLMELFSSMKYAADGIGHFTHLGGLLVGFLYIKKQGNGMRLPRPLAWFGQFRARRKGRKLREKWDQQRDMMEAVDKVLDRINEVGFENLTDEEKQTLDRASSQLSSDRPKN
jgi:membrane associated rhomboid family serine protease